MIRTRPDRNSITRRRFAKGLVLWLAAEPLALGHSAAEDAAIKIGLLVPLSGLHGAEGEDLMRAAQVAIAEFNGGGGLSGREAELLIRDDKSNPAEAAERTRE